MAKEAGAMAGVVNLEFWRDRRVFLTGHTGFKGAWLSLMLHRLGAQIVGYSLDPPTQPSLFAVAHVSDTLEDHRGDILDRARLSACLRDSGAEIVIHMAAQSLVRLSYTDPVKTYADNVMGTAHVLDAIRSTSSVRAVVVITTDKCYENKEWLWGYREIDRLGGHDPYSNSKACAEFVTQSFRDSFFPRKSYAMHRVGVATVRAGNAIGGGDWAADRLIPDAVRAVVTGRSLEIRYPGAIRPWQHLLDPLAGYLTVAERLIETGADYGEAWNFGPDATGEHTVSDVLESLRARWSDSLSWHQSGDEHPHEATFLKLDCSKSHTRLGWRPRINFGLAMDMTAKWYERHRYGDDMRVFTEQQIADFLTR